MHPNVDQLARDAIDDLGLVDDDNTPDMRKAPVAADALRNEPTPNR
ncbi:hypothetical protein [Mycolicibacterium fortuitum]|nr:hypothetical protein [Mycolicibacterium fortuitum]AJR30304.1 hypothetical protein G155_00254 [Mycobacterium sp. VKM Ac-1817D]CRL72373.1 hypothetical protein CPGR_00910 [Mycolicibacter nonchromogenicus]WEV32301.1 hypothetical protein OMF10_27495 [Mycolicibacterium fortuitum]CRL56566.1 hypothetical protein CPGR_03889 [Mycolicibacterium fortuitum subsp. fortuitum DSM 46621 = ATCC 6841 = JCM 6387]BDE01473.1 hypothetical protein MFTT_55660 [Mycolicibacterium fortuitum subsp. fortuitum]